jgi:hypothetical protein
MILITETGVPGIIMDGTRRVRLDHFSLSGPARIADDPGSVQTGPGITSGPNSHGSSSCQIGQIWITSWNNAAIDFPKELLWSGKIDHVRTYNVDAGEAPAVFNLQTLQFNIGHLHTYPITRYSGKDSDILRATGDLTVDRMNIGAAAERAVVQERGGTTLHSLRVNSLNYEPTSDTGEHRSMVTPETESIVHLKGDYPAYIGHFRIDNNHTDRGEGSAKYAYKLDDGPGNKILYKPYLSDKPGGSGRVTENWVNLADSPSSQIFYFGAKEDGDNNSGQQAPEFNSMDDPTFVFGSEERPAVRQNDHSLSDFDFDI